ncbi:penicillin acylase family protein [Nonomuraea polychroma]|uniref:penicillin acylase family protein n=1 Tax=Nonomuraea polychroma TaxID=46176 RepID=UPI001F4EF64D|nr:penicillin acylase family protein [Nonomuraea polychroma]
MAALSAVTVAVVVVTDRASTTPDGGNAGYQATIRRTAYGIPHVLARDHASLGFGYGYAFAQDNLCVLAERVVTLRGERSRYFGVADLDSDIYHRAVQESGLVRRLLDRAAPLGPTRQVRDLVDGYVAGYNRYLRDTGVARLPDPTCRGKDWVGPITASDIWHGALEVNRQAGSGTFQKDIATAAPPRARPSRPRPVPSPDPVLSSGPVPGSNGWALGREATRGGSAMLLANPHYPWTGSNRFYQVHLTIPGQLNVSGASLYGTPVVQIGHTAGLAWTHTVSHARRFTLYELDLADGDPTSYVVDGRAEPMRQQRVTVTVRGADGKARPVTRVLYSSRYGPVLATGWTATTAFALADPNAANLRSMNEWLAMGAAQNLAQLRAAQNTYQGLPFVYTIAADSGGTVSFADASVVPHVTDSQTRRCITTAQGRARYPGRFILDGSTAACAWGADADAVEPGVFGPGRHPRLTRTDYVSNSNNSPWLTNPEAPISGYPRIYGDTGADPGLRPRLSLDMISQRLSGADGLREAGFTLETLQATTLSGRNHSADLARADLVAICRAHPVMTAGDGTRVNVRQACDTLARWNGRSGLDSRGAVLWREFFTRLHRDAGAKANAERRAPGGEKAAKDGWWRVPFDRDDPLTTPRGLDRDHLAARRALAETVRAFRDSGTSPAVTLGEAQRRGAVPLHGCTDLEGCFDLVEPSGPLRSDGRYPEIANGSSFIMAVELTPQGPRARTILTYSQSANPASPHHTDQTELYSRKKWVNVGFTEHEINSDPELRTTTVRG